VVEEAEAGMRQRMSLSRRFRHLTMRTIQAPVRRRGHAHRRADDCVPRHRDELIGLGMPDCLLKRHLGEAPELAAVQLLKPLAAQDVKRANADTQMLVDALAVERVGHAGQLDLAVQRLVAHA
jgi:hypothetical protein